ncbi:MFS transporter [Kineococcus sp. T13]|uniref:MFS transporter n=1 Tax=Kineococcus vitellinus TaxID=2696565 RepID=UPI0014136925|nr:MFS transporter [Kineococcus vitellinus]
MPHSLVHEDPHGAGPGAAPPSPPPIAPLPGPAVLGVVGFLVLGAVGSAPGPALPTLRARHDLDASGAALLLTAFSLGATLGVLLAGAARRRVPDRASLVAGAALVITGCALLPEAPGAAGALGALLLIGAGFGVVDLLLNLVLAGAGPGGSLLMAASAAFGIGAVGVPLLVGWQPQRVELPFRACAGGALLLAVLAARLRLPAARRPPARTATRTAPAGGRAAVVLLGAVLLGYVTLEGGVAGWETTHLRATTGASPAGAAGAVALFWCGLTLGRLLAAPLVARLHPRRLLLLALGAGTLSLLAAAVPAAAVLAYALAGLSIAPVFPAVVAWHTARRPEGGGAVVLFAAALAGPVLTAPVTGALVDAHGAQAVPWVLAALAAGTTALVVATRASRVLR